MFRKPPSKKSPQFALEVASLQEVVVNLDEPSEEALSGGAPPGSGQTDPTLVWSIGFADVSRPSG